MKKIFLIIFAISGSLYSQVYKPGDHDLLIMPTAYTMESGSSYFSDYEVVLLNYTVAITPSTHLGAFSLFPMTSDFLESFSLGFKQKYFQNEIVSSAVWGSYFIKAEGGMIGNTISVGERNKSIHVGIASAFNSDSENEIIFMIGGRYDTSEKLSLIAEYMNAAELMDTEFKGLLTFGFRFRSENISWELAGIRPLIDTGDLFLIPLLKATFYFE